MLAAKVTCVRVGQSHHQLRGGAQPAPYEGHCPFVPIRERRHAPWLNRCSHVHTGQCSKSNKRCSTEHDGHSRVRLAVFGDPMLITQCVEARESSTSATDRANWPDTTQRGHKPPTIEPWKLESSMTL